MREKPKALIMGAGAVGRGLLAPTLIDSGWRVTFYDTDVCIMGELTKRRWYPLVGRGQTKWIGPVSTVGRLSMYPLSQYNAVFISVKAQNLASVAVLLQDVATRHGELSYDEVVVVPPVFLVENLMGAPEKFAKMCMPMKVDTYGSIANVIVPTSPMAEDDPLFTVYDPNMELILTLDSCKATEHHIDHACYIPSSDFDFEMDMKMFLHCTLHVLAAYLGINNNIEYIHEVIDDIRTRAKIIWGLNVIVDALVSKWPDKKSQIYKRAKFELESTGDKLFWDDVYRVGRDPERKLEHDDRLIGAMMLVEQNLSWLDVNGRIGYTTLIEATSKAIKLSRFQSPDALEHCLESEIADHRQQETMRGIIRSINKYDELERLF